MKRLILITAVLLTGFAYASDTFTCDFDPIAGEPRPIITGVCMTDGLHTATLKCDNYTTCHFEAFAQVPCSAPTYYTCFCHAQTFCTAALTAPDSSQQYKACQAFSCPNGEPEPISTGDAL